MELVKSTGLVAIALAAGCASAPTMESDYLDRGIAYCTITPSDGVRPCTIDLETSDERVLSSVRSLTGCAVRTRQIERQPAFGVF